jgi:hypothetical protein
VVFVFQSRATLHDYLARSSSPNSNDVLAGGLRDEITGHLRHAKRTQLAATVDKITDETTLRVIITEARALSNKAGDDHRDNSASIGIDTVYVRAAEHVLGLEPGG